MRLWTNFYHLARDKFFHIYNPLTIASIPKISYSSLYSNWWFWRLAYWQVKGFDYLISMWGLLKDIGWTLEIVGLSDRIRQYYGMMANMNLENSVIFRRVSDIDKNISIIYFLFDFEWKQPH